MAEETPRFRRSLISQRTKFILDLVPVEKIQSKPSDANNVITKKKHIDPSVEECVNKLYARPYSMTSSIFEKFCDTQTTFHSYHFQDLNNYVNLLNESFPSESKGNTTHIMSPSQSTTPTVDVMLDLTCNENMPSEELTNEEQIKNSIVCDTNNQDNKSPQPSNFLNLTLDFDSDDSVRDKNYIPSELSDCHDDSDDDVIGSRKKCLVKRNSATLMSVRRVVQLLQPETIPNYTRKRRNSVDSYKPTNDNLENVTRRRQTIDAIDDRPLNNTESNQTKKRRVHSTSLQDRIREKKEKKRLEYTVKPGCNDKCLKKCTTHFTEEQRNILNREYWNLTWEQRRQYIRSQVGIAVPKRKYTSSPKRNPKRSFLLKKSDGNLCEVCKAFFLTTLGFKKNNDKVFRIGNIDIDKRGKHQKTPAYDRQLLTCHVESFHPYEPHYRREHAPLRRYLPSDLNITHMHKDVCKKYPHQLVSYELYRKHLKSMNISFTRLGNEECEVCESYHLHKQQSSHDATVQLQTECSSCIEFTHHHAKYTAARELYTSHKSFPQNENQIFYSGDLEKVIMLPRMETFKSVIFCQRLIAFNQTFAPVGKITVENKPITLLWHDAIAGRRQEDIMSAFYAFLIRNRDIGNVNIWLDNCSAQNKNWLLFSLLVYLVNSDLISCNEINLYYFEPGHTFMSSDQVHHQVELAMKKKGKLYDFQDFVEVVSSINNGKVNVEAMSPQNFLNVPNFVSDRRIQKSNPRAYLKNMVQVTFKRSNFDLYYKNNFNEEFTVLRFMNDRYLKNPSIMSICFRSVPKGIESNRKSNILDKLTAIMPPHKQIFWRNLPMSDNSDTNQSTSSNII